MKKALVSLAAAAAIPILTMQPSAAEPVPGEATGIWSVGECGGDGLAMLIDTSVALIFETREGQASVAMAGAEWVAGFVVATVKGEGAEFVLPPLDALSRCSALPGGFSLVFAESVAVLGEYDALEARCMGGEPAAAECVALATELVDVSGDGVFSKAELSRAVRAASFFIGYGSIARSSQSSFVPLKDLFGASIAASLLGPFLAGNLIDSYDFDGDGQLSLKELFQDRLPQQGVDGVAAGLAMTLPPKMMAGLMSTMTGLLGGLR
ncbi:MAG: hypothetical protein OXH76_23065 [Boseongicola sp.]|nr:hypothetical protein [Boseongicola sp.]